MSTITEKYAQLGGQTGFLGKPTTIETVCPDKVGHYRHFEHGSIYWSPSTGAWEIHGDIRSRYSSLGWEKSVLGYPLSDETPTPDTKGRFNHFQYGSIYWHPDTGAWEIHGDIRAKYSNLGWEKSFLGYPLTNETKTPDGKGRYNHFQGGSIYWYPGIGAFEVHGAIRQKWSQLGWEKSVLGYPKSDETSTPGNVGRYNHFENGSIYWTPATGAHEVHGAIRGLWSTNGWENRIGFPLTDETPMNPNDDGRYNTFQKGSICWTPKQGAWFDFVGDGEGKFSGNIKLYLDANYAGTNFNYPVSNSIPFIFKQDLSSKGLHDNVTAIKVSGLKETCSSYYYENADFNGRYIKLTGTTGGAEFAVANVGGNMNDKISAVMVVNHGTASVILTTAQLNTLAAAQIASIHVDQIRWTGSPSVTMVPGERSIKITIYGVVEATWPDSDVQIDMYFRPYVAGATLVKLSLARWWAHSGGSFAGYANSTILDGIKKFFNDNTASLENSLNTVLASRLNALNSIPDLAKSAINVRRVNIIPEGFELVISDTAVGALLVQTQPVEGLSVARPSGAKTEGSI
jgi:hypothetical protein